MILLPCAWCGPRDASEFHHVGEAVARPDPGTATPQQWRGYLYLRANPCGWTTETWYHQMGCRRFMKVERHTQTNEIRAVWAGEQGRSAGQQGQSAGQQGQSAGQQGQSAGQAGG